MQATNDPATGGGECGAFSAILPQVETDMTAQAEMRAAAAPPGAAASVGLGSMLAGWASAVAGPVLRLVLKAVLAQFLDVYLPRIKEAVTALDPEQIRKAINDYIVWLGGPADAV